MGGGTTKVGDPTGKDESRKLLSDADIDSNIAGIRRVFERFLSFDDGPTGAIMVNNDEWLSKLEYIPFLRDVGRHFTINRMLTFDSVRLRLDREQPLTFLEFNYMILQAYDFLELSRRAGCRLQMGGSDQWGNIVNGIDLGHRLGTPQLFALTSPLITTSSGANAQIVAHTALAGMLALARRFPQLWAAQAAGRWAPLVQAPLPAAIGKHGTERVFDAIDPRKDVDGFHVASAGALVAVAEHLEAHHGELAVVVRHAAGEPGILCVALAFVVEDRDPGGAGRDADREVRAEPVAGLERLLDLPPVFVGRVGITGLGEDAAGAAARPLAPLISSLQLPDSGLETITCRRSVPISGVGIEDGPCTTPLGL